MNLKLTVRSKISDLYRDISDFKKGYQPTTNIIKNEMGDLVADPYSIVGRWRNYFSQLLNMHGVNNVRHTEIHIAEPLMPEPSASEVEMAIEMLKSHKSLGIDQNPAKLRQGVEKFPMRSIHIISIWNKEELPEEWKESIILPIYKGNKNRI